MPKNLKSETLPLNGTIISGGLSVRQRTKMSGFSVWTSIVVTIFSIASCLAFSFLFQRALSGFSKQVNAFVSFGDFGSIFLQSLVAAVSVGFVLYLCFVYLASARIISEHLSFCSSPCLLFLTSFTAQGFLIAWVLLLCFVSSITLVYFIFIGSIYSFCALIDQQCFDFKVLIPAIVSKISNNKVDMIFCAEKKELLCSKSNNQIWAFMASFVCCLFSFGGALVMQNFIVFGLGRVQSPVKNRKGEEHHYEMKEVS